MWCRRFCWLWSRLNSSNGTDALGYVCVTSFSANGAVVLAAIN